MSCRRIIPATFLSCPRREQQHTAKEAGPKLNLLSRPMKKKKGKMQYTRVREMQQTPCSLESSNISERLKRSTSKKTAAALPFTRHLSRPRLPFQTALP